MTPALSVSEMEELRAALTSEPLRKLLGALNYLAENPDCSLPLIRPENAKEVTADLAKVMAYAPAALATRSPVLPSEEDVARVLIAPDDLQERIRQAYLAGAHATHEHYQPDPDPDFSEASYDYVASLDFTEDTRPHRPAALASRVGETQRTISEWADATFGPAGTNYSVAARANQEMAELLTALAADDHHPKAVEEVADVVIVLMRLVHREGGDLQAAIDAKMAVNRARRWNLDGNGHGYHVKDQPHEGEQGRGDEHAVLSAARRYADAVAATEHWRERDPYPQPKWRAAWDERVGALRALMRAAEALSPASQPGATP